MATENKFGDFFRSRRKALSPRLREFCRKNGFDAANLSRLERGLVRPPQARKALEAYAKSLKLEAGTADWDRFFELAAAETGRIPADVMEDKERLPALFLQLRAGAQGQVGWVKARHLESWADTLDARATLPQLLRRLIQATGKEIRGMEFPAEEQIQRPGWDGIAEAGAGGTFVPEGTSGWEMGADKDPRKKADEDFSKRTKSPLGLDPKKTTFVFVTPRKWQKKSEWVKDKSALGAWKEVRVYDSASLEEWLERSPAVDAWLADRLGLKPEGVISFDDYWANLQALTTPSLAPGVFLASREAQVKELVEWLDGPAGALTIETRSPAEAIDFVVACSREPKHAELFATRALIVEDRNSWRSLASSLDTRMLLVAHPSLLVEPELVAEAVRKGNRVLLPSSQAQRGLIPTLRLTRPYRGDLEKALESSGIKRLEAQVVAGRAGGSLTVLKRLLGRCPGTTRPAWSEPQEAPLLVPILLTGRWDESWDGDRAAIEKIANRPYDAVAEIAERWQNVPDAPVTRIESRWGVVSRDDSWFLLASTIRPDVLRRFEEVALDVLAEDDPSFELPPERRWEASALKKGLKFSPTLRNGLSETLALLGSRPEGVNDAGSAAHRADRIVRKLLDGQGWIRWASLSDQLSLLAEAGPETFLEAVERDLRQAQPALARVFKQDGNPFYTSMPQTGLLRALEVASWNRALLPQVSLILASLDEKMPEGKIGNTPLRCLSEIFMTRFPQTTAPPEERVKILGRIMKGSPDAGWRLLLTLLPNQMEVATEICRPSWRDWALSWSEGVTNFAYWHQVTACARMLVEAMGEDVSRWKALIENFENLPVPVDREFLARLNANAERIIEEDMRRTLSDTIEEKVADHRRFPHANWALPEAALIDLEAVRSRLEPKDTIQKVARLFRPRWQVVEALQNDEQRVEEDRIAAIQGILEEYGWEGVLSLKDVVATPDEVGATIAAIGSPQCEAEILPTLLGTADEKSSRFVNGYLQENFRRGGWDWIERLNFAGWSAERIARVLFVLPFGHEAWEFVERQGTQVSASYWQNVKSFSCPHDYGESVHAIGKFLESKRASAALHAIGMALHQKHVFPPEILIDVLQSWLDFEMPTRTASEIRGVKYHLALLFSELQRAAEQDDTSVDIRHLATLEWACLALLDGSRTSPVTLHRLLRDEPAFFVKVLGTCFRSKDAPARSDEEFTEKASEAARNAYRLLKSWQKVPGSLSDETVGEEQLFAWIKGAHVLAEAQGLLEICDSQIGQILAHAPYEADGSWPCVPVRDALEKFGTEDMFAGFNVGIFNKRGMFWKTPREGGAQERTLAEKYRGFADACKVDWPRTAAALRRVALEYEEDARREDLSAEME